MDQDHSIRSFFYDRLHDSLSQRLGLRGVEGVESYLTDLLVTFMHDDRVFGLRDIDGKPIADVTSMIAEGDIRLNADSFEREREVHKHIGDFILFWSGLYPEHVERRASLLNYERQGKESYFIVSTFEYGPHAAEAPLFRRLSEDFEAFRLGLHYVRSSLPGFRA